jgi:SsrA-binding protein
VREKGRKAIATNRKARHNYSILDVVEAGVALVGTEVKSLRDGKASLVDAFATVDDGEIWLRGLHIAEYTLRRVETVNFFSIVARSTAWPARSKRET